MKKLTILLIVVTITTITTSAYSQNSTAEIENLRQQVSALRQGSIQSNSNAATAVASLQELQTQFEALKSSIDANTHLIKAQSQNLDVKLADMNARLGALEDRLKIQSRQVTSAVSTVAPEAAAEAELYQVGLNQINDSAFLKAVASFKKFLSKYPKSEYASHAQYWKGECYFAMRDYETAIKEFQIVREKYPKSEKAPAALLKQGYSFYELDMDSDAKTFLNAVMKKYPRSREAKEAKARLESMTELKKAEKKVKDEIPLAPGVKTNNSEKYR